MSLTSKCRHVLIGNQNTVDKNTFTPLKLKDKSETDSTTKDNKREAETTKMFLALAIWCQMRPSIASTPVNARAKNMFSTEIKRLCFRCQTWKFPRPNLSLRDLKCLCFRYQTLKFRHISVIYAGFSHIF